MVVCSGASSRESAGQQVHSAERLDGRWEQPSTELAAGFEDMPYACRAARRERAERAEPV